MKNNALTAVAARNRKSIRKDLGVFVITVSMTVLGFVSILGA